MHAEHRMRGRGVALEDAERGTPHCRLDEQKGQRGKAEAAAGERSLEHRSVS
jgi:hypothetical protein